MSPNKRRRPLTPYPKRARGTETHTARTATRKRKYDDHIVLPPAIQDSRITNEPVVDGSKPETSTPTSSTVHADHGDWVNKLAQLSQTNEIFLRELCSGTAGMFEKCEYKYAVCNLLGIDPEQMQMLINLWKRAPNLDPTPATPGLQTDLVDRNNTALQNGKSAEALESSSDYANTTPEQLPNSSKGSETEFCGSGGPVALNNEPERVLGDNPGPLERATWLSVFEGDGHSYGNFEHGIKNDAESSEFISGNYPHTDKMITALKKTFGLVKFRLIQAQAINAALLGHDCFILMPTGGGKSLCYQLPAVVSPGVTLVVSPLKSLMQDQVEKLASLDIPVASLSGDIPLSEQQLIYQKLQDDNLEIKLLYVTPEKIFKCKRLWDTLQMLYAKKLLSRLIVDECHCVSCWGADFRQCYSQLGNIKKSFPNINVMALTATATATVQQDVMAQLGMKDAKFFYCSFNRPNLKYEVIQKTSDAINDLYAFLCRQDISGSSGIIYCLTRKKCTEIANALSQNQISAAEYHAGLTDTERRNVQIGWFNDSIKVVCATVAFGMGVDKPDCKFVIHYVIPRSLDAYYQESGRAGRDGFPSYCMLFYSKTDACTIRNWILSADKPKATKKAALRNFTHIVNYCEDMTRCRRAAQLRYFGEKFDRSKCREIIETTCDNCLRESKEEERDVTVICRKIIDSIKQLNGSAGYLRTISLVKVVDILKGSGQKEILRIGSTSKGFGLLKQWIRDDIQRLLHNLIIDDFLEEDCTNHGTASRSYLTTGHRADEIYSSSCKIFFSQQKAYNQIKGFITPKPPIIKPGWQGQKENLERMCYVELVKLCKKISGNLGKSQWCNVMSPQALQALSKAMPTTKAAMCAVEGVSEANYQKYGTKLLPTTTEFAQKRNAMLQRFGITIDEVEKLQNSDVWIDVSSEDETDNQHGKNNKVKVIKPFKGELLDSSLKQKPPLNIKMIKKTKL